MIPGVAGELVLEGRETISVETFERTSGAGNFKAWFELFNNAVWIGRVKGFYHFRCSDAVLTAVAKAGFNVYQADDGVYAAVRRTGIQIQ